VVLLLLELPLLVSTNTRREGRENRPNAREEKLSASADVRTPVFKFRLLVLFLHPFSVLDQPSEPLVKAILGPTPLIYVAFPLK
jgi:hypothetical protein